MSKELEDLKKQEEQLLQESKWDELIPVYTEMIALKGDPKDKAAMYHNRGHVYRVQGDNDRAIVDFNETIGLAPDDALAYYERGIAYANKAQFHESLADFDMAIELNPSDARMYCGRGVTYIDVGNHKAATDDFEKAMELDPKGALAYQNCSLAYGYLGRYEKAIELASKAIKMQPTEASVYLPRAVAYFQQGLYGQALNDFVQADKYDPNLRSLHAGIYLASRIDSIYDAGEEKQRDTAFGFFYKLVDAIRMIQERLFCGPENVQEIAHYTTLYALRSLAQHSPFRLSNGAYMNDPEEGRAFFEIMEDVYDTNIRDSFYEKISPYPSPAYIGSFTKVPLGTDPKDELFLWRTYGKHDAEEAVGACLIFKHDGRNFAETLPPRMGYMPQPTMGVSPQQRTKPALYRVVYRNNEGLMSEELSKELSQLSESLEQIEVHVLRKANDKGEQLRSFACELLDSIRFLFKKNHYKEEQEVRIIEARHAGDEETWKSDGVKVDVERIPPRFYLEAGNLHFSEVILGPRTRGVQEWTRWLKEQDEDLTVNKSEIEYGERYPYAFMGRDVY